MHTRVLCMETAWRQSRTPKELRADLSYIVKMTTDVLQPCKARLAFLDRFPSSCASWWNRTTSLRMEAFCKQRCNVVEQTPSRLRVAAHFVCSIYQSKADNEIYDWNKGSHRLRVNNGSQGKRDIPFYLIIFWGTKRKVQKQLARIGNVSPIDASKRPHKISELTSKRCWVMKQNAGKNSWR